jgi:hypothetical protein
MITSKKPSDGEAEGAEDGDTEGVADGGSEGDGVGAILSKLGGGVGGPRGLLR